MTITGLILGLRIKMAHDVDISRITGLLRRKVGWARGRVNID